MLLIVLVKYESSLYLHGVSFPEVICQIVLDLSDELLGVVGIQAEHFTQSFEADVLQVTVCKGLNTGVGFNHFLLCQIVRANQVAPTWKEETQAKLQINDMGCIDFNGRYFFLSQSNLFFSEVTQV